MIWFVRDFDLISLILRAVSFALEALTFGGVFFLIVAARPARLPDEEQRRLRRTAAWFALALVAVQLALLFTTSAVLLGSNSGMALRDLLGADYFISGSAFVAAAVLLFGETVNGVPVCAAKVRLDDQPPMVSSTRRDSCRNAFPLPNGSS